MRPLFMDVRVAQNRERGASLSGQGGDFIEQRLVGLHPRGDLDFDVVDRAVALDHFEIGRVSGARWQVEPARLVLQLRDERDRARREGRSRAPTRIRTRQIARRCQAD